MKRALLLFSLLLLLLPVNYLRAQADSTLQYIDVARITVAKSFGDADLSASAMVNKNTDLIQSYSTIKFIPGLVYRGSIPDHQVTRKAIIRFRVCNSSDTAVRVWFFPGFCYWSVNLYQQHDKQLKAMPSIAPDVKDNLGFRQIIVPPHDSTVYYAELFFVRTYVNTMNPRLIHSNRINTFMTELRGSRANTNIFTYVFCGLLLMMIFFSIANFFQDGNKEFLYYAGYAFFLGGMLFTKSMYDFHPNPTSYFFEGYFDFIMQCIGYLFYMLFMRQFLNTRVHHRFLYKLYNIGIIALIAAMILFSYFHYFTDNYVAENFVENWSTKFLLIIMGIIFIVYSIRQWKDKLFRYLFWGNLLLLVFSALSFLFILIDIRILPGILGSGIFYYELGIFFELVFFLAALNHKNRKRIIEETRERERLKTDNQLKEYEKEIAVYKAQQEERQRISADMHDELGAGMTAIRLMSEIARNKMKESTPIEIEKISHSADEVLNKMNAIIWSMNSGNDTLDNLVSYIRSYAIEYFEGTPVDCRVTTPDNIPATEVIGDKRRNVFLCVKETLNNALKHSQATLVQIEFIISDQLVIRIQDNGIGIDMQKLRQFGNGLKNIRRRMESIGGTYAIENNNGTLTVLTLPV
ncbi:MAG TPA: sensor histidine kinase [Chitinophagaceae bacterium]|jgi:signal transduction histidine kinase|nr:sensor histidine kinase [Chitinophagaceae bacterium]